MGLFWRRKKDEFVSLRLNEPAAKEEVREETPAPAPPQPQPEPPGPVAAPPATEIPRSVAPPPEATPPPEPLKPAPEPPAKTVEPLPVPSRSAFSSSILGLDRSIEELQAQEAALEQEFSARFRRAVAATRESLSEKLDTVFAGRKQIDEELLDQLEEVLIAADIGVPTTLAILETVRRGIARKQINDLDALKQEIGRAHV